MRNIVVAVAVGALGCGGKPAPETTPAPGPAADDCQTYVDKTRPIFEEMDGGNPLPPEDSARFLELCRADDPANRSPLIKCVLAAADQAATRACFEFGDGGEASSPTTPKDEAMVTLDRLGRNLKAVYTAMGEFTIGKAGPLPAQECCKQPDGRCAAVTDPSSVDRVWGEIEIYLDEPGHFRYSYTSDGKTATVTAVGDLDCDGRAITYTLEASAPGDNPTFKIIEPPANSD